MDHSYGFSPSKAMWLPPRFFDIDGHDSKYDNRQPYSIVRSTSQPLPISVSDDEYSSGEESASSATHSTAIRPLPIHRSTKASEELNSPLDQLIHAFEQLKQSPFINAAFADDSSPKDKCLFEDRDLSMKPHFCTPVMSEWSASGWCATHLSNESEASLTSQQPQDARQSSSIVLGTSNRTAGNSDYCQRSQVVTALAPASHPAKSVVGGIPADLAHTFLAPDHLMDDRQDYLLDVRLTRLQARRPASLRLEAVPKQADVRMLSLSSDIKSCPMTSEGEAYLSRFCPRKDVELRHVPFSLDLEAMLPTAMRSSAFPTAPHSKSAVDHSASYPTQADLLSAIHPYPMEAADSQRQGDTEDNAASEDKDDGIQKWTLQTYRATQSAKTHDSHSPDNRPTDHVAQGHRRVSKVQFAKEKKDVPSEDRESITTQNLPSCSAASSEYDPFLYDVQSTPLRSGCMDVAWAEIPNDAVVSLDSEDEDEMALGHDILTAPPTFGRAWHRGRRDGLGACQMVAPEPYKSSASRGSRSRVSAKANRGKRFASASATMSTFSRAMESGSQDVVMVSKASRQQQHPTRSPYPSNVSTFANHGTPDISSPQQSRLPARRPSDWRGQGVECLRMTSTPVRMPSPRSASQSVDARAKDGVGKFSRRRLRSIGGFFSSFSRSTSLSVKDEVTASVSGTVAQSLPTKEQGVMTEADSPFVIIQKCPTIASEQVTGIGLGLAMDGEQAGPNREAGTLSMPMTAPAQTMSTPLVSSKTAAAHAHSPRRVNHTRPSQRKRSTRHSGMDLCSAALQSRNDSASPVLSSTMMTML